MQLTQYTCAGSSGKAFWEVLHLMFPLLRLLRIILCRLSPTVNDKYHRIVTFSVRHSEVQFVFVYFFVGLFVCHYMLIQAHMHVSCIIQDKTVWTF